MPLPAEVTITGSWLTANEQPATGSVVITPVAAVTGGGYIIAAEPVVATLANGAISVLVINNTNVASLQYQVIERIDGAPAVSYVITPTGTTLDLSSAPRSTTGTAALFVLASTVGQAGGVASLDGTGKVPTAELPSSSGVTITSPGGTITVGGTASAPTLDVNAITQSQVTGLPAALTANATAISTETSRAEAAEALLAPLASPALTGTPTAPTKPALTASPALATTAYTDAAVAVETGRAQTAEATKLAAASNLSDVANAGTALGNLGGVPATRTVTAGTGLTGGGDLTANRSFTVAYGTAAGTAAQGNDARITGAAQTGNNLSDLANAGTARSNLGLGSAATQPSTAFDAAGAAAAVAAATQSLYVSTATQTGTYTAAAWQVVPCNASSGSFTVNLPTGAGAGVQVAVKLLATTGTNTVTVAAGGTDVINQAGTTSAVLALAGESFEFTSNGAGVWFLAGGQKSLGSLDTRYGITVNVLNYGAKRNYASSATGAMTASSAVLTDTNAAFTSANVGQYVTVVGAGAAGVDLTSTISSVTSGTQVTLAAAAATTVSGATYRYGSSDSAAIQAAITAAGAVGGTVFFPPGGYVLAAAVVPASNIAMVGAGIGASVLYPFGTAAAIQLQATSGAPLANFTMAHLTIDGSAQSGAYNVATKGIFTQYCSHLTLDDLVVQNTVATGIGTDFLQNGSMIHNCRAINCGRLNHAGVNGGGGNGIGIGTGGYTVEDWVISDCYATGNGRYGIMLENQFSAASTLPTGMRIIGCYSSGNFGHGYGDAGGSGVIWSGCVAASNSFDGFSIDNGTVGATAMPSGNSVYTGCVAYSNSRYGFSYQPTANNAQSVAGAGNHLFVGCKSFSNTSLGFNVNSAASHPVSGVTFQACEAFSNGASGWQVQAAANDIKISDCKGNANGQISSTSKNGITIGASVTGLYIGGCRLTDTGGTQKQAYGVQVSSGATVTTGHVTGNDLRGNLTGALNQAGTLASVIVRGNPGYNPVGSSSVTPGASPYTYTAGATDEVVTVAGGTVSAISYAGTATGLTSGVFVLASGQTLTVTYSATPTMITNKL